MSQTQDATPTESAALKVYEELCTSYRAIDEFRARLLGLLPLATAGTGIFLLLGEDVGDRRMAFFPIGIFGIVTTLGLFVYELYGIKKCGALIAAGKDLEQTSLKINDGQFARRPQNVLRFLNEPFAAAIIYPAVLAAWAYIALAFAFPRGATWIPLLVFLSFAALAMWLEWRMRGE